MTRNTRFRLAYMASDLVMLNIGWTLFNLVRYYTLPPEYGSLSLQTFFWLPQIVMGQILIPLLMLGFYALSGFYNEAVFKSRLDDIRNTFAVTVAGMLAVYFAVLVNDTIPERMRVYETMLVLFGLLAFPTLLGRLAITYVQRIRGISGPGFCKAVIVGDRSGATMLARRLQDSRGIKMFEIVGIMSPDEASTETLARSGAQAIIVAPDSRPAAESVGLLATLYRTDLQIFITPHLYQLITSRPRIDAIVGEPLINITNANLSPSTQNFKRVGDVVFSAAAMMVLLPVYAAIALAVRIDSPGPVIYRQQRLGYHKKKFYILKFRTMRAGAEEHGPALSAPGDSRITRVGRFLRKYRLDELPQFWNVLRGHMSLVGPRPEREFFARQIQERVPYYSLIHQVRPGITSLGMVKYGYATTVDEMIERLRYDLLYIENVSFGLDIKILFHTVNTVITGRGI